MNKRGFLATLAAMCVAPFAVKADPPPFDLNFRPLPKSMLDRLRKPYYPRMEITWSDLHDAANTRVGMFRKHWGATSLQEEFAAADGVVIDRWTFWGRDGWDHVTALGHHADGDVWVHTFSIQMPREP